MTYITIACVLERIAVGAGLAAARLGIPLVIVCVAYAPIARWLGWATDVPVVELSTLGFLAATMTSFGYAYARGRHVRLDILSRRFPSRVNAAAELAGTVLILIPLCALVIWDGAGSTWLSLEQGERWGDTALPLQWLVRLWVPLGFALLMAAALASAARALRAIQRK
jgi:TRAP-type mannitol/chloroaromatic compound transport system permease small subunit